eukprot:1182391-Prorocentrum_minimum.AAC.6
MEVLHETRPPNARDVAMWFHLERPSDPRQIRRRDRMCFPRPWKHMQIYNRVSFVLRNNFGDVKLITVVSRSRLCVGWSTVSIPRTERTRSDVSDALVFPDRTQSTTHMHAMSRLVAVASRCIVAPSRVATESARPFQVRLARCTSGRAKRAVFRTARQPSRLRVMEGRPDAAGDEDPYDDAISSWEELRTTYSLSYAVSAGLDDVDALIRLSAAEPIGPQTTFDCLSPAGAAQYFGQALDGTLYNSTTVDGLTVEGTHRGCDTLQLASNASNCPQGMITMPLHKSIGYPTFGSISDVLGSSLRILRVVKVHLLKDCLIQDDYRLVEDTYNKLANVEPKMEPELVQATAVIGGQALEYLKEEHEVGPHCYQPLASTKFTAINP